MIFKRGSQVALAALALAGGLLCGCENDPTQSKIRLSNDFGAAVNQDLAAQIADPDAGRNAGPPPPGDGARAALAQTRYKQDKVIPPSTLGASGSSGYAADQTANAPTPSAGVSGGATAGP
jgi:type IV pilus biogenesis protein CpaD/CtpE